VRDGFTAFFTLVLEHAASEDTTRFAWHENISGFDSVSYMKSHMNNELSFWIRADDSLNVKRTAQGSQDGCRGDEQQSPDAGDTVTHEYSAISSRSHASLHTLLVETSTSRLGTLSQISSPQFMHLPTRTG
jgi:hypothetical protein